MVTKPRAVQSVLFFILMGKFLLSVTDLTANLMPMPLKFSFPFSPVTKNITLALSTSKKKSSSCKKKKILVLYCEFWLSYSLDTLLNLYTIPGLSVPSLYSTTESVDFQSSASYKMSGTYAYYFFYHSDSIGAIVHSYHKLKSCRSFWSAASLSKHGRFVHAWW